MTKYVEQFWRDATAEDVVRVMAGETVEARFREKDVGIWHLNKLRGAKVLSDGMCLWLTSGAPWHYCQVYAPHQWFINKPEPGEGYRLLEKFPGEPRQPKDDVFVFGVWQTTEGSGAQPDTLWYRRRIEQPKPEPKHYVLRVGDTCDAPSGRRITITEHGVCLRFA